MMDIVIGIIIVLILTIVVNTIIHILGCSDRVIFVEPPNKENNWRGKTVTEYLEEQE